MGAPPAAEVGAAPAAEVGADEAANSVASKEAVPTTGVRGLSLEVAGVGHGVLWRKGPVTERLAGCERVRSGCSVALTADAVWPTSSSVTESLSSAPVGLPLCE